MTVSKVSLCLCSSFIGGIFINSFFSFHFLLMNIGLVVGILLISVFWHRKKVLLFGFCILFLILGVWRHRLVEIKISESELQKYNDKEEVVTFVGLVLKEPDVRENHVKIVLSDIDFLGEKHQSIDGKILVTLEKYPEPKYGDRLEISGRLQTPQIFDEFNYKEYLVKDGIYSVIYYPQVEFIEKGRGNFFYSHILSFKNKLREIIYQNLSPPQSSILAAIILGDKRQISQEWKEKLNYAGIRHLTAISGMHVAVLTVILMSFLIGLGFWRHQAFYLSIILIFIFIALTGFQTSALRAGIMGGLFLFAQHLGRMNFSSRAIILAAALMLIHNPLLLRLDVGFQLSFLAMMGIIYLVPIFQKLLRKIPNFLQLKNILAMTLSAQVFTLPILIYNFGYFSLVAPFANLIIVPLLPFIMGLGFVFVLLGLFWSPFGWLFSLPLWLLLTYLVKIAEFFSSFSFSAFLFEISWFWLVIFYFLLVLIIWRVNKEQKLKFLSY